MKPDLTIATMNDAYLAATMRKRDDLVGRKMFEAFPSDPESESHKSLQGSFERVLRTGQRDEIALIRYDIELPSGEYDERYWSATHIRWSRTAKSPASCSIRSTSPNFSGYAPSRRKPAIMRAKRSVSSSARTPFRKPTSR
jgi:hypothetical protein